MTTRTKIYLLIISSFTFFALIAYKNNQPKQENQRHSEIQSIKNIETPIELKKPIKLDTEKLLNSSVFIQGNRGGLGSGFIIDVDGEKYVLGCNHVASFHGQTNFILNFYHRGPNKHPVTILGTDKLLDVALLKFDAKEDTSDMPPLKLGDSDQLKRLDPLIYLGNPWPVLFVVDFGKVIIPKSNLINQLQGGDHPACLIHDCPTAQGSSGGAILNSDGEVVAINQRFLPNRPNFIHYAGLESNAIKIVLKDLTKVGELKHWEVQVLAEMKDRLTSHHLSIDGLKTSPKESGLVIFSLMPNTASKSSDLALGDIVLEIDGHPMKSVQDFYYYLYVTPHDENFEPTFKVSRASKELKITVKKREKIDPIPENIEEIFNRIFGPSEK